MRQLIIILALLAFTSKAQAGLFDFWKKKEEKTNETTIQMTTASGQTIPVVLTGNEFAEMTKSVEIESTRRTCFTQAYGGPMPTDSHAQVAREFRLATQEVDCGTNMADAEIAKQERLLGQTKVRWGAGKTIAGYVIGGATVNSLGGKLIDGGVAIASSAIEKAGNRTETTINNDNGSTVSGAIGQGNTNNEVVADNGATIQGNVGEGNVYEDNDEGIITNPADIQPIALGSGDQQEGDSTPVTDVATIQEFCEAEGFDFIAEDGRCSNGSGRTVVFNEDGTFTVI